MSKVSDLHEKWSRDADYRTTCEELGPEFEFARSMIGACGLRKTVKKAQGLIPWQFWQKATDCPLKSISMKSPQFSL